MSLVPDFDSSLSLSYLGLPENYEPSPRTAAIPFLIKHLMQLPPHLLQQFSRITSAKERTAISVIRNRRLKYTSKAPPEFQFTSAISKWPHLWQGQGRWGIQEGAEEKTWADKSFLGGMVKHVGKLGGLLSGYEEEREVERVRKLKKEWAVESQFIAEEDESSDEEEAQEAAIEEETPEEARASFDRLIRERFIYGMLDNFEYENVDWDDTLDEEDEREAEDRWFDEDDE